MPIHFEHSVDVARSPERAFAVLDDFSLTPKWLARCACLEALTQTPHAVGTRLKYDYREAGRTGTIKGEITARTPSERLTMHYSDKMMDVTVDFRIAKSEGGARLTHAIDVAPKTLVAKLFSSLIRRQLPSRTITAMESLKALLEAGE